MPKKKDRGTDSQNHTEIDRETDGDRQIETGGGRASMRARRRLR